MMDDGFLARWNAAPARGDIARAFARIVETVAAWEGITPGPHRFGGTEFRFRRGEIGHLHEGGLVDVAFPKPVRDELVRAGKARPHHVLPESGWVSFTVRSEADVPAAVALLRFAYDLRREKLEGRSGPAGSQPEPAE